MARPEDSAAAVPAFEACWTTSRSRRRRRSRAVTAREPKALAAAVRANRQAGALRDEINRHRNQAEADRERADRLVSDSRSDDLRKRADEHDAEVVRLQAQLKAVERENTVLQKQEAAIRDEMLVP